MSEASNPDVRAQITDNGDGTLTVRGLSPSRVSVRGPDGRPLSHFSGLSTYELLIDHGGTPGDPTDDEVLEFLSGPSHGTRAHRRSASRRGATRPDRTTARPAHEHQT